MLNTLNAEQQTGGSHHWLHCVCHHALLSIYRYVSHLQSNVLANRPLVSVLAFSVVGLIRTGHEDGHTPILLERSASTNKDSCSEQLPVSRTNSSCPSPSLESCAHEDIEADSTETASLLGEASLPSAETPPPVIKDKKPCLHKSEWRHRVHFALYFYFY